MYKHIPIFWSFESLGISIHLIKKFEDFQIILLKNINSSDFQMTKKEEFNYQSSSLFPFHSFYQRITYRHQQQCH